MVTVGSNHLKQLKMTETALERRAFMEIQSEKRFFTGWPCKQGGKIEGLLDASQFIDKNKFGVYVHGK